MSTPISCTCSPKVIHVRNLKNIGDEKRKLIYIGREMSMGKRKFHHSELWANPFKFSGKNANSRNVCESLANYRKYIVNDKRRKWSLRHLKNAYLACWCSPELCHGDVLVSLYRAYACSCGMRNIGALEYAKQVSEKHKCNCRKFRQAFAIKA